MESLSFLLAIIFVSIVLIILSANYLKVHPFFTLILACFFVGFCTGMNGEKIVITTSSGFGSILSGIGLIVVFGTIIGVYLERSGALDAIAHSITSLMGSKRSISAMAILGAVVSVPVFCDSGFIILSKLSRILAEKRGISSASMSLALASGLYTTHTLIPPTPGAIAVAGNINMSDQLGIIVLTGLIVAIPVLFVCIFLAKRVGSKIEVEKLEYEASETNKYMHFLWASSPILVPITLITANSLLKFFEVPAYLSSTLTVIGHPLTALMLGCILAMVQALPRVPFKEQGALFKTGIEQAGPILLITGAGGAFGAILKATPLEKLLTAQFDGASISFLLLLVLAFVIAAVLKTAQGSSTSALVIGSSILAPFVLQSGVEHPFQLSLLIMAFGGGAMTVSHANDSYFWVVTQFSGFDMKGGYRGFSFMTFAQGITTLLVVLAIYWVSQFFI